MATYTTPTTVSAGQTLTASIWNASVKEDIIFLANPPMASAYRTATSSIANDAWSAGIAMTGGEDYDTDGIHAVNSANFVIVTPGKYEITALAAFAFNATGERGILIDKNGATQYVGTVARAAPTTLDSRVMHTITLALVATDVISMQVRQSSGGALNLTAARLQLRWVSQ